MIGDFGGFNLLQDVKKLLNDEGGFQLRDSLPDILKDIEYKSGGKRGKKIVQGKKTNNAGQSKQQQKFMGIVRQIQKGEQQILNLKKKKNTRFSQDDMKKKDVEKFTSTKHKGLPKKVEQTS